MKLRNVCAVLLAMLGGFSGQAFADGNADTNGVRVFLGSSGKQSTVLSTERGVRLYRGAAPSGPELAGETVALSDNTRVQRIIIEHHYHSRIAPLRTQGFYSGHPGKSRRFIQGFYSGPVDKGRRMPHRH